METSGLNHPAALGIKDTAYGLWVHLQTMTLLFKMCLALASTEELAGSLNDRVAQIVSLDGWVL